MFESPSRIFAILNSEVGVLESFLLGNVVYRQVRIKVRGQFHQHLMSLGDFLEHRAVWKAFTDKQLGKYTQAERELAKEGDSLLQTFEDRAKELGQREIKSRLDSLSWNLEGWAKDGNLNPSHYSTEMVQRSRIQRLGEVCGWSEINGTLKDVDSQIKTMTSAGGFIWSTDFVDAFPADLYWFLYRKTN